MKTAQSGVVLAVHIGIVRPLDIEGRQVMSAIRKTPLAGRIRVDRLGLEDDEQADPSVHGGLSKAVYAYPSEHYEYWRTLAGTDRENMELSYGSLGENLTLRGLTEGDVFVGDELHFPDCVLRITQPRQPCCKFNAVMKDRSASRRMVRTGFSGFYLSVKATGSIAAGEKFILIPGIRDSAIESLLNVGRFKARND